MCSSLVVRCQCHGVEHTYCCEGRRHSRVNQQLAQNCFLASIPGLSLHPFCKRTANKRAKQAIRQYAAKYLDRHGMLLRGHRRDLVLIYGAMIHLKYSDTKLFPAACPPPALLVCACRPSRCRGVTGSLTLDQSIMRQALYDKKIATFKMSLLCRWSEEGFTPLTEGADDDMVTA